MNNRPTILLLASSLLVAALGWRFLAGSHQPPASSVSTVLDQVLPVESLATPPEKNVLVPAAADYQTAIIESPFVVTDALHSVEDEDYNETLARSVGEMNVADLTQRLEKLPLADLRGNLGRLLVRRWAELDPVAAGRWVTQLGDAEAAQELSTSVALAWSARDLPGALDWAYALPAGELQNNVVSQLDVELARIDPEAAMRLAVEELGARDGVLLHALGQWTGQDAAAAQNWALQLSLGPLREQALATVATVLANQDGERAARFAVEQLLPGPEQDRAVIGIIQRWAQLDYDPAEVWVASFPPTPLRENAIAVLGEFAPGSNP